MDERCKSAHAKILAGRCPWCGRFVLAGIAEDAREMLEVLFARANPESTTLQQLVGEQGELSFGSAVTVLKLIAKKISEYHKANGPIGVLSPHQIVFLGDSVFISSDASSLLDDLTTDSLDDSREVLGVADYLAPEQALTSQSADGRADIYSLGCILHFVLTGHPPFSVGTVSKKLLKHQLEAPPSILEDRPDAPSGLVQLCEKMLAKSPQDRYQSAEELLVALQVF